MTMSETLRAPAAPAAAAPPPTPGQILRRRILGHWSLMGGLAVLGLILLLAVLAPLVAPDDP